METLELSARLRYLNDVSHLLSTTAPVTSRYLMSRHDALLLDSDIGRSDAQRRKACGACGTPMILGWEATAVMRGHKKTTGKVQSSRRRAMVYRCGTCDQTTRFPVNPAPKIASRPAITQNPTVRVAVQSQPGPSIPSTTQKKRSKAAKNGGLRALLQKKKENTTTSSGFDLMDFMKTSGT